MKRRILTSSALVVKVKFWVTAYSNNKALKNDFSATSIIFLLPTRL